MDTSIIWLSGVVVALVLAGSIGCLPLFNWDLRKFLKSLLWIKIIMWLPIYAVILVSLYAGPVGGTLLAIFLALIATIEFLHQSRQKKISIFGYMYVMLFLVCIAAMISSFWIINASNYVSFIAVVYFGSVISDVTAFFCGNYLKQAPLPAWINVRKSWYGVVGQLIGGVIGVWIAASIMGVSVAWWFGLMIGIASAIGDLANSVAKRQLDIKDWGNTIPGHGGILDRCSSLSAAFLGVWLYLVILGN